MNRRSAGIISIVGRGSHDSVDGCSSAISCTTRACMGVVIRCRSRTFVGNADNESREYLHIASTRGLHSCL